MNRNQYTRRVVLFVSVFCLLTATAHSQRAGSVKNKKIFATALVFKGVVKNVDPNTESVTVSSESIPGQKIPGRLPATNIPMTYKVDNPEVLKTLKPGDRVTANVLEGDSKVLYNLQAARPEDTPVFFPKNKGNLKDTSGALDRVDRTKGVRLLGGGVISHRRMQTPNNKATTWPPVDPIEGLKVRLHCISIEDVPAIADIITPDVSRWLASWPANPTLEAIEDRITRAEEAMQSRRELHFRIEEREQSVTIGYVSVAQAASHSGVGHLSYWLGSAFQGKGLMTEAVRHAMDAGFQYLNLERIEAGAQPENLGSFAVMRRLGMSPIGERLVWADNRQRNERCFFYSIDRSAFQAFRPGSAL